MHQVECELSTTKTHKLQNYTPAIHFNARGSQVTIIIHQTPNANKPPKNSARVQIRNRTRYVYFFSMDVYNPYFDLPSVHGNGSVIG